MLKSLHIKNYVLIDSLDIEFPAGLVIITGQTGAGKSILMGALSLVTGAKADTSVIGTSGDSCVVEAEFSVADNDGSIRTLLDDNEIDFETGKDGSGILLIRRVLNANGRSRTFVNDSPAQLKVLAALSSRLIDIHSQHETMLLRDKSFQMSMLDHFAGNSALLLDCGLKWKNVCALKKELADVSGKLSEMRSEREYNQAQYSRLESAALRDGELEELEAEQKQLANAEEIKSALYQIENHFSPSSDDGDERMSVDAMLKESSRLLDRISAYVPAASALSSRLESSRLELDDILSEISDMESRTEVSNDRLQEVEERLSLLYDLMKKYSCTDVEGLVTLRDSLSDSLADTTQLEERKKKLEADVGNAEFELEGSCAALHDAREKALPGFSSAVCESIRSLELERAVFDVILVPAEQGASGYDSVLFRFSSTGKDPQDVAKCASGGEMSRIMLCLKAMMARYTNMPTMIFDEIDTGVSGSVADKMGSMICSMGAYMQVFAITHLPQVAAKGDAHYIVTKSYEGDRAVSEIRKISGKERVMEIARILSGSKVTPEAVANAESLLGATS